MSGSAFLFFSVYEFDSHVSTFPVYLFLNFIFFSFARKPPIPIFWSSVEKSLLNIFLSIRQPSCMLEFRDILTASLADFTDVYKRQVFFLLDLRVSVHILQKEVFLYRPYLQILCNC